MALPIRVMLDGSDITDKVLRGRWRLVVDRQTPAGRQQRPQAGDQRTMIGQPLDYRVGEQQGRQRRRLPVRQVALFPLHPGRDCPRLGQHRAHQRSGQVQVSHQHGVVAVPAVRRAERHVHVVRHRGGPVWP